MCLNLSGWHWVLIKYLHFNDGVKFIVFQNLSTPKKLTEFGTGGPLNESE